jgi:hypothetical protein
VFLFDRNTRTNALVSHALGQPAKAGDGLSGESPRYGYQSVSPDGRFVGFWSSSTDLVPTFADQNAINGDLFIYDRVAGENILLSHALAADATGGNGASGDSQHYGGPVWSADSHFLFFASRASDLIDGDFNNREDVFAFSTLTDIRFRNISTRVSVGTGDHVGIGGFILHGTMPKTLLMRARGPSLQSGSGPLSGRLSDPIIELHDSSGNLIKMNNNWHDADNAADIASTGLAPTNDLESAILMQLDPGTYTVVIGGAASSTGIGLVEVYDVDLTSSSDLANISTRGLVQSGDGVMIGGIIMEGDNPRKLLVRAIGPELQAAGITDALPNPMLEVHDSNGTLIGFNDDWMDSQASDITATGLQPGNNLEAAILLTNLPAGDYTAIVTEKNNTVGVGLVEAFNLGNP